MRLPVAFAALGEAADLSRPPGEQAAALVQGGPGPCRSLRSARRMTVDVNCTSPIGIPDMQYQGNAI